MNYEEVLSLGPEHTSTGPSRNAIGILSQNTRLGSMKKKCEYSPAMISLISIFGRYTWVVKSAPQMRS